MILDILAAAVVLLGALGLIIAFFACVASGNWIAAVAIAAGVAAGVWLLRS